MFFFFRLLRTLLSSYLFPGLDHALDRFREVDFGTFVSNTIARNHVGGVKVHRGRISHMEYNSIQDNRGPGIVVEREGFVSFDRGNSISRNDGPARIVARHGEEAQAADGDGLRCWGNKGDVAKVQPAGWPPTPWCVPIAVQARLFFCGLERRHTLNTLPHYSRPTSAIMLSLPIPVLPSFDLRRFLFPFIPSTSRRKCDHHGTGRHDVFLSYRVKADGPPSESSPDASGAVEVLFSALEGPGDDGAKRTVFWDAKCLNTGARARFYFFGVCYREESAVHMFLWIDSRKPLTSASFLWGSEAPPLLFPFPLLSSGFALHSGEDWQVSGSGGISVT